MKPAKVRLFVEQPLGNGQTVLIDHDQAHYLFGVMRMAAGDFVKLFNGKDGEHTAEVVKAGKGKGILLCQRQSKPLQLPPDLWLCFSPIKKARTNFIVEKAAEMGANVIQPVHMAFTNSERIRRDRLQAHAVAAAEQCGGTYVPEVRDLVHLDKLLATWPEDRKIMLCDEALVGGKEVLGGAGGDKWAIFIGPEGGFSETEREKLRKMGHAISLGPRILRADTAAVAALTIWQQNLGDWG